ncbi:hypothetical protein AALO_G00169940 [Alosa alosa]|uniref:Uncharacterized protein n=1 Tax=Alosa alosa TaxID=278164 RepID=A0AAV6GJ92_9TELE|nr:hypothetical protein AALO_G00169940 [Alosa alosa]
MKLLKLLSCCIRAPSEDTEVEMQRSGVEVKEMGSGVMADRSVHLDMSCDYPDDLAASLIALFSEKDSSQQQSTPQLAKEEGAGDQALAVVRPKLDSEKFRPRVTHERPAPQRGEWRTAPTPEQRDAEEYVRREILLRFFLPGGASTTRRQPSYSKNINNG